MTHCGLPDFLFVFFLVFPLLYYGKTFKHDSESVLNTQLYTSGSSKSDAIYLFKKKEKTEMSKTSFVPTRRYDTTNNCFRISPRSTKSKWTGKWIVL